MGQLTPYGAERIIATRRSGFKPAVPIAILLAADGFDDGCFDVVVRNADREYDWRFLAHLDAYVVTQRAPGVGKALQQIANLAGHLEVWLADEQKAVWVFPTPAEVTDVAVWLRRYRNKDLPMTAKPMSGWSAQMLASWVQEVRA